MTKEENVTGGKIYFFYLIFSFLNNILKYDCNFRFIRRILHYYIISIEEPVLSFITKQTQTAEVLVNLKVIINKTLEI